MDISEIKHKSIFQSAISAVEALSTEEQAMLIEIIQKRLQQQKRDQLKQEIEQVRQEYKEGKVKFGSVEDFLAELDEE
jgi:ribosomal protein L18E